MTEKTRKLLWGKSGNRCAICKKELTIDSTLLDSDSIIGEECHIISPQPNGPRHLNNFSKEELDQYDNLILLCRVHHKMIDDQYETYNAELVKQLKSNHEKWVNDKLNGHNESKPMKIIRSKKSPLNEYLPRISSAKQLIDVVCNICASDFDNEDLHSEEEIQLIGDFFQELQYWGDFGLEIEPLDKVRLQKTLQDMIDDLESHGFWIFAKREEATIVGGLLPPSNWPIAIIRIQRTDNNNIIKIDINELKESKC